MVCASFTSGWLRSRIWSSRARKRSVCPVSRRSLGRMESPRIAPMRAGNHAASRRSICNEARPQPVETGKHEYLPRAETHTQSERCEFFTDDSPTRGRVCVSAARDGPSRNRPLTALDLSRPCGPVLRIRPAPTLKPRPVRCSAGRVLYSWSIQAARKFEQMVRDRQPSPFVVETAKPMPQDVNGLALVE